MRAAKLVKKVTKNFGDSHIGKCGIAHLGVKD